MTLGRILIFTVVTAVAVVEPSGRVGVTVGPFLTSVIGEGGQQISVTPQSLSIYSPGLMIPMSLAKTFSTHASNMKSDASTVAGTVVADCGDLEFVA